MAVGGVIDSLSFDVHERWHLTQFGPILADRKSGEGDEVCKDWTFFMDVILISRTDFKNGSSFLQTQSKTPNKKSSLKTFKSFFL